MPALLYDDLTKTIRDAFYAVFDQLGQRRRGLDEAALTEALRQELVRRGLTVRAQVPVAHRLHDQAIGEGWVDLLVAEQVALEIKVVQRLTPAHEAQLRAYLAAGGWAVGLLLNFGGLTKQFKRCYDPAHDPTHQARRQ